MAFSLTPSLDSLFEQKPLPTSSTPVYNPTTGIGTGTSVQEQTGGYTALNADKLNNYQTSLTSPTTTNTTSTSSSSSSGDSDRSSDGPTAEELEEQRIKNQISTDWDDYIGGLDNILNGVETQKTGMEGVIGSQLAKAENTLGGQLAEGQADLQGERQKTDTAQQSNFTKLAEDLRNQMQAGNIYLGARGAGDSSAANMYSYALGRQGNQIRGDVMQQTAGIQNEINKREGNLKRIYNTEINNAREEYNEQVNQVAIWYGEQQVAIENQKATASKDKAMSLAQMSMDLLNQAKQTVQNIKDTADAKQAALDQWAINNSNSINEVRSNLAQVSGYYAPGINMGKVSGAMNNSRPQTYASASNLTGMGAKEEDKDLISFSNNLPNNLG